ncbi:hypothetical protein F5J12DRAFT_144392 [Pisolithus orientalis]|uniref:uncharacterized protein n=1 Tax=Pisolithus orientalis TaxID=936130 RepID=UPI0022248062|nr:uncharacterized protein F5J12DRAFT_144392 [Pisolithus orientalis]KAI6004440.1 hypothetical protein F5J12DRAFT_144392 [Pisolithus orientalis]
MFHDHSFFKYFPVDNWESPGGPPSIGYRHDRYREVDVLARRLTKHQEVGRPLLHVQLVGSPTDHLTIEMFSRIPRWLRSCCVLDLVGLQLCKRQSSPDATSHKYFCLTADGSFLYIRVDTKDTVILDNWREASLENMDVFWLPNGRLSLSNMSHPDPQVQASLSDADGDCNPDHFT